MAEEDVVAVKQQLVEAYNRKAKDRDATPKASWKVEERNAFLDLVSAGRHHSLLEIGCGTGQDSLFFQEHGLNVVCVDMTPAMIELCRDKGLDARVMDFSNLTFPDESFDAIWALNCLLHVPKHELPRVLDGIRRVLKPGGLFYMGVYGRHNSEGIWEDDDYQPKRFFSFFDEEALTKTLAEFFTIVSFKTLPHSEGLDFQSVVMVKDGEGKANNTE